MTAALVLAGLVAAPAGAAELPKRAFLPLALASKAAMAALARCNDDGYAVSAAVVDRSGVLRVLVRADDAGPHTTDSSRRKAYTAASLRESTQRMAELVAARPEVGGLAFMNESILVLGGGLPIRLGGEVVGGIGVGGAPGAHLDEACARAGLESIGASAGTED